VPRRRLLVALVAGAGIIALAQVAAAFWLVAAAYHAALLLLVVRDAALLPRPRGFTASREVPQPLSLFKMIRRSTEASPAGVLSAYEDLDKSLMAKWQPTFVPEIWNATVHNGKFYGPSPYVDMGTFLAYNKQMFKDAGITKAMLAEYYTQVWDLMAPHVDERVLMHRRVSQIHSHLAVLDLSQSPAPLSLHARRLDALLRVAGLVDQTDAVQTGVVAGHGVVQSPPQCVFVPLVAREELLECAWSNAGGQGHGLDALLGEVGELAVDVNGEVLTRIAT